MNEIIIVLVSSLLSGGIVAGIAGIITARATAKKTDMERALVLIDQLQEDNQRLRNNLRHIEVQGAVRESEIVSLRLGVLVLVEQLREMGVQPRWTPKCVEFEAGKEAK